MYKGKGKEPADDETSSGTLPASDKIEKAPKVTRLSFCIPGFKVIDPSGYLFPNIGEYDTAVLEFEKVIPETSETEPTYSYKLTDLLEKENPEESLVNKRGFDQLFFYGDFLGSVPEWLSKRSESLMLNNLRPRIIEGVVNIINPDYFKTYPYQQVSCCAISGFKTQRIPHYDFNVNVTCQDINLLFSFSAPPLIAHTAEFYQDAFCRKWILLQSLLEGTPQVRCRNLKNLLDKTIKNLCQEIEQAPSSNEEQKETSQEDNNDLESSSLLASTQTIDFSDLDACKKSNACLEDFYRLVAHFQEFERLNEDIINRKNHSASASGEERKNTLALNYLREEIKNSIWALDRKLINLDKLGKWQRLKFLIKPVLIAIKSTVFGVALGAGVGAATGAWVGFFFGGASLPGIIGGLAIGSAIGGTVGGIVGLTKGAIKAHTMFGIAARAHYRMNPDYRNASPIEQRMLNIANEIEQKINAP